MEEKEKWFEMAFCVHDWKKWLNDKSTTKIASKYYFLCNFVNVHDVLLFGIN